MLEYKEATTSVLNLTVSVVKWCSPRVL